MARGKATGRYAPDRRSRDRSDDGGDARWLTTYGDAITLLMAFFVMLYAMSQIDQMKFEAFVRGLRTPFGNSAGGEGLLDASSGIAGDAGTQAPTAEPRPDDPAPAPAPPDLGGVEQLEQVKLAVETSLRTAGFPDVADYRFDERGLVVSIATDDVLFATGSTAISDVGRRIVAAVAEPLRRFPNDVVVEGHTDDVPLTRPGYTNWNLSTDRAVAVLSLLVEEFGVAPERLGAAGYGEFRPRTPNDTGARRALNRRVDVLVVTQGG